MIRRLALAAVLALPAACGQKSDAVRPPPHTLTPAAVGHFCGMVVEEHEGPKGQILLKGRQEPVWFTSARDAIAFTLLPEEPRDIAAVYVSDMAKAQSWAHPGPDDWVEAHDASFVLGSSRRGGMGGAEAVPLSDPAAAQRFAGEYGGRVVRLDQIPSDYILGGSGPGGGDAAAGPEAGAAGAEK